MNIYSANVLEKDKKKTETLEKNNKDKIASDYSANSSEPVKTNTVNEPQEEVFDVPKKIVSTPQRNGSMVNPYYTYSGTTPTNGESALLRLKREFDQKKANDPNFVNSNNAKYIKGVANEVRRNYGLSEAEHGSGASADYVNSIHNLDGKTNYIDPTNAVKSGNSTLDNQVKNALSIYNLKKSYEENKKANPNFDATDFAKYLNQQAETIRRNNALPDELKGTGITADELLAKINYVIDSPEFQSAKADTDYLEVLKRYDNEKYGILTTEDKKRAILSYLDAQEQAKNIIKPQAEQAISDTINSQDTAAIRRGMYGQVPASALKANALANTQNQINSQINDLALELINQDDARATEEYNIRQQNRQNKLSALEALYASEKEKWQLAKQRAEQKKAEEAAAAQAEYDNYWREREWNREEEQRIFDNNITLDERNESWEDMRHDNLLGDNQYALDAYDTEFNHNLELYKAETDRNYKTAQGNAALIRANKSGSSSSANTGGISKNGVNYIDNVLKSKIQNRLEKQYSGIGANGALNNMIIGKGGNYATNNAGYEGKAYFDVICDEVMASNLSDTDAILFLNQLGEGYDDEKKANKIAYYAKRYGRDVE